MRPRSVGQSCCARRRAFALFRQQVGRCLRPKRDGSAAIIIDHVGNVFRHGLPDAPHEWSLDSKKRTQAERQQAAVGCRRCQSLRRGVRDWRRARRVPDAG